LREHADPTGLEPGRPSLVGSSITPVALGAKPPQTRRWAGTLTPASRCGTAHRAAPIHAAAGRAVLHSCDPRACSAPCPSGMAQGRPCVEISLYDKEELNGSRTRWLRLCDHTLPDSETQPLDKGGVALPPYGSSTCLTATPVSHTTRCVTRTRRHRTRDQHLWHTFMISKRLVHGHGPNNLQEDAT
jgi:hypothetical protein